MAKKMTREKTIELMMQKANALLKDWTWDNEQEIWTICTDWNSAHDYDEEIFMCEHVSEETGYVDGFYIEDDYWIIPNA